MNLKSRIKNSVEGRAFPDDLVLTIALREDHEEGGFIAECLDIPGCVSEGETQDEAVDNVQKAIRGCLEVMFEDCVREMIQSHRPNVSYVGISEQRHIALKPKDWDLQPV